MPDLRSGIPKSKRVNNIQENPAVLVPTRRRGTGRGKGFKAAVLKSPPLSPVDPGHPSTRPRSVGRGRGRGCKAMNPDKNAELFGTGIGARVHAGFDPEMREVAAIPAELAVERSAKQLAAAEGEGSTNPLPEREYKR